MAPSRRRAGQRVPAPPTAGRQKWKVGDLVLAKVKGFPAWPATVSDPGKWGHSADSKKVVVCFFGGEQIAFCNPADLEEFTEEKKVTLVGKRHGKGADFSRAVKEIIRCFEKLKKQNEGSAFNGSVENIDSNEINSEQSSSKPVKDEATVSAVKVPSAEATYYLNCLTDAAMAAAAEESLGDEGRLLLEESTSLPMSASDLTMNKTSFSWLNSSSESRKSTLRSRNALHTDNGIEKTLLPSMKSCRRTRRSVASKLQNRNLRRSSRIMKLSDDSEGQAADSHLSVSHESKESDSEVLSVESDTPSVNDGLASDSDSKPMEAKVSSDRDVGRPEFGDRQLNFHAETSVSRKKRMPSRRRNCNDNTVSAKVESCSDAEVLNSVHALPCPSEKLSLNVNKDDGDEHLPLVKRARVRMGRSSPSMTEQNGSVHEKQKQLKDPESHKMHRPDCKSSFVTDGFPSVREVHENVSLACKNPTRPHFWYCRNDIDGESILPPSKRIHRALEAMSANVAEDCEKASCSSLTVSVQGSGSYPSAKECSEMSIGGEEYAELLSETAKDVDNHDSDVCAVSDVDTTDNNTKKIAPVPECGEIDVSMTNPEIQRELIERGEGADTNVKTAPACDFPAKTGIENYNELDSANAGEKLDSIFYAGGSGLNEADQKSDADILRMNSISNCMEKIALSFPKINSPVRIGSTAGEGDDKRSKSDEVADPSSFDSNIKPFCGAPIEVLDNGFHQPLQSSMSYEYRDGPGCSARGSQVCSLKNTCLTDSISLDNDASQSPISFLHPEKQTKPFNTSSSREDSLSAFESVMGMLTRTKDSIGHATRMAIDCANSGFANKVVEILVNNLERESSLYKKVNLFFLVDSITQCSRTMKGDGVIYLSAIQTVLPRLLSAAAPPCSSSLENHQQCLKVLKVWLERKILPEPIIRHHIRELESVCCSYTSVDSRGPLQNERALDDRIRQMEGMLADEYGSNSSIQLPDVSIPAIQTENDERNRFDGENLFSRDAEQASIPTTQKHSCILEDVEGELEMEDVAPCLEDETGSTQMLSKHHSDNGNLFNPQQGDETPSASSRPSQCHLTPASVLSPAVPTDVVDSKHFSSSQNYNREFREPPICNSQSRAKSTTAEAAHHHRVQDTSGYFEDHLPRKLPDSNNIPCPAGRHNSHFSGRSSNDFPSTNEAFSKGFHFRPPHPASSSQFSYGQERVQSRRGDNIPPPHYNRHRTRYIENGNFYRNRERNKFIHRDSNSGEYWRLPYPAYNSGPCYEDGGRMNHPAPYGGLPREPPFPNNRWHCPPGPSNHRHVNNHYSHCEGPIPVENRASDYWRPR